jgi:Flp pilus assembly protein TadG
MARYGQPLSRRRRRERGQSLVEFSLVIPMFIALVVAIAEFSLLFSSFLSVGFASHDAVQLAATYGNTTNADSAILLRITNDISTPADPKKIKTVDIYQVDTSSSAANPVSGAETIYTYDGGAHTFTMPDLTTVVLPFVQTVNGYPTSNRCNANAGIGCTGGKTTVDTIGVKITYQYAWLTPFPALFSGSGSGPLITQINIMRLEPIL